MTPYSSRPYPAPQSTGNTGVLTTGDLTFGATSTYQAQINAGTPVPETGPLPGAYAKSALPMFERRLAEGELALYEALDELDVRKVDLDADLLANVNTERDLDRLRSHVT